MRAQAHWSVVGALGASLMLSASPAVLAEALSGKVTSAEEPVMEGVLVTVKKDGSTISTTVVSDDKGAYNFPADRLDPGKYSIKIRAGGYLLDGPKSIEIAAGKPATADIKLTKTKKLSASLSNGEWLMSFPGTDKDKDFLTGCVGCHTLQRIASSTHDSAEFTQVFKRMGGYSPGSTPLTPQPLLPGPRGERAPVTGQAAVNGAAYLAKINLSDADGFEYPLKTLPRPKGRATKVIVTEYDLPRREAQPHDVIISKDGKTAYYSDFGSQFVGEMDTKTGKATDHPIAVLKPEQPKGGLQVSFDPDGNVWVSLMYQAGIAKLDVKSKKVDVFGFPKEWQSPSTQASMVAAGSSNVDGMVWTNNQEDHSSLRLDTKTGKFENIGISKDAKGTQISGYGMPVDKDNNLYLLEFGGTSIGRVNAKTKEVKIWKTPLPNSKPRRGKFDDNGVLWFAEYGSNAIASFDPKTEKIKEWQLPTAVSAPYDAASTKDGGQAWTGSMVNDQVARLDVKDEHYVEYLLPRPTNIRKVFVDESGQRPVMWAGSNHGGSIVRVEPLD